MGSKYIFISILITALILLPNLSISIAVGENVYKLPVSSIKIHGYDGLVTPTTRFYYSRSYGDDEVNVVDTSGYWSWQDYPFPVPSTEPVEVNVLVNGEFAAWKPVTVWAVIPEGEWSKILLRVDGKLYDPVYNNPIQYDRVLWIYANDVPILWGSTPQRYNWTVTTDVTLFYSLFKGNVTFEIWLPNVIAPSIGVTGRFLLNVTLLLYPGEKPANLPDVIIPLWKREVFKKNVPSKTFELNVPQNVTRAVLLLHTKGNGDDEFWYYNGDIVRELKIYSDDKLLALVHPMHTIYTGGFSPYLWRPLPSVRAYAEEPTFVDLTGALPLIVGEHNLTVELSGIYGGNWQISGALLLWTTDETVKYELVDYSATPSLDKQTTQESGYTHFTVTSEFESVVSSKIYVGDEVFLATSYYKALFTATRKYNDYYDNLTINEYRVSKLTYDVLEGDTSKSFEWVYEWNAPLDVKYNGVVEVYGDLDQASVSNPVPGAIVEYIVVTQELRTKTQLTDDTGTHNKVLAEKLHAAVKWNIDLIFISHTGAVVTGVGFALATNGKTVHGLLFDTPVDGEPQTWIYTRATAARTYVGELGTHLYEIVGDNLYYKYF
ncbi:MAG: hypothetical protein J7L82_01625 [Staphylothermus sp.]|nr:hypothetical protein [Staphylothermus sp.]